MKLLVATRSDHKLNEVRTILGRAGGIEVVGPDDVGVPYSPEEEGLEPYDSFEENAVSKARYFHARTGLVTVADDSGLCVDALGGRPGVRSKRFAPGEMSGPARDVANNAHLLELLDGVADPGRGARYVCVAALIDDDGEPRVVRGEVEGTIATLPRGEGGFGYDPLFHVPALGRTFGEATAEEKHAISHRGRAFRALAEVLSETNG